MRNFPLPPPFGPIPPVTSYSSWARGARPRGRRTWPLPVTPSDTHSWYTRPLSGSARLCPSSQQGSLGGGHCHPPTRPGGPTLASVPQAGGAYSSTPGHPGNPRPSGRTRVTNTKQQQISGARVRGGGGSGYYKRETRVPGNPKGRGTMETLIADPEKNPPIGLNKFPP